MFRIGIVAGSIIFMPFSWLSYFKTSSRNKGINFVCHFEYSQVLSDFLFVISIQAFFAVTVSEFFMSAKNCFNLLLKTPTVLIYLFTFSYGLFNDAVSNSDNIGIVWANDRMNNELERIWKETFVA
jgi:hypothetical protein